MKSKKNAASEDTPTPPTKPIRFKQNQFVSPLLGQACPPFRRRDTFMNFHEDSRNPKVSADIAMHQTKEPTMNQCP